MHKTQIIIKNEEENKFPKSSICIYFLNLTTNSELAGNFLVSHKCIVRVFLFAFYMTEWIHLRLYDRTKKYPFSYSYINIYILTILLESNELLL